ncbi:hypothetical protein V8C26DRAFT_9296 [Trichoderma gracile]
MAAEDTGWAAAGEPGTSYPWIATARRTGDTSEAVHSRTTADTDDRHCSVWWYYRCHCYYLSDRGPYPSLSSQQGKATRKILSWALCKPSDSGSARSPPDHSPPKLILFRRRGTTVSSSTTLFPLLPCLHTLYLLPLPYAYGPVLLSTLTANYPSSLGPRQQSSSIDLTGRSRTEKRGPQLHLAAPDLPPKAKRRLPDRQ